MDQRNNVKRKMGVDARETTGELESIGGVI